MTTISSTQLNVLYLFALAFCIAVHLKKLGVNDSTTLALIVKEAIAITLAETALPHTAAYTQCFVVVVGVVVVVCGVAVFVVVVMV